ncbi:MAG: helix-turn-helix domain-containing protein [Ktedonobacteraceae bacterium]|nr:helix-turn-helix domain-containing protein [Ktedonobacteraceae bacterium]
MTLEIDNETFYSVKEACLYLGIARDTLYRRIHEGHLQKYTQVAKNRVYFRFSDLKALKALHPGRARESHVNSEPQAQSTQ